MNNIHTYIHTYIHVLLKNNIFVNNYNGARFYRKLIDTGPIYMNEMIILERIEL